MGIGVGSWTAACRSGSAIRDQAAIICPTGPSGLLFAGFQKERFRELCEDMGISRSMTKSVKKLSDGNRMKLMLAAVLSRDTELLIMDEPASPLDPLMREQLCDRMRDYLEEGDGERSIFFSTHNIADMENVTDYCLIMEHGTRYPPFLRSAWR